MSGPFDTTPDYDEAIAKGASAEEDVDDEEYDEGDYETPRGSGILGRVLKGIGVMLLVLVVVAVLLYNFGSMWVPSAEVRQAYAAGVEQGVAPPIERQFHIPIPGCVCHSSDPALQMQHESRRIKDCMSAGCHG